MRKLKQSTRFIVYSGMMFLFLVFISLPSNVNASSGFVIDEFKSNITLNTDGTLTIIETINVNYQEALHGIYRDIPVNYKNNDGSIHYTKVTLQSIVLNGANTPYQIMDSDGYIRFKIGDPDKRIIGQQTYVITYAVAGVITPFSDHDELYWNVTGNNWEVPITSVKATVTLPAGDHIQVICYTGIIGSQEQCLGEIIDKQSQFLSIRSLAPGEGLTIVNGFTKGIVPIITVERPLTFFHRISLLYIFLGFISVIIPVGLLLLWLWWQKGRDEYYQRTSLNDPNQKEIIKPLWGSGEPIVPEYEPPLKLRPAELGVVLDEKADSKDISATIVDLAVRGYLTITEISKTGILNKKDYELTKTDKEAIDLLDYEKLLLETIFKDAVSTKVSEFKYADIGRRPIIKTATKFARFDDFYSNLEKMNNLLYQRVTDKKLFFKNPEEIRSFYQTIGVIIMSVMGVVGFIFYQQISDNLIGFSKVYWYTGGVVVGGFMSGFLLRILASAMPKRTAYGREIYRQALGYKLFVSGTEKYRQPFFEKENIFMAVLPYAIIFGVTKQLATAMREMGIESIAPWYIGGNISNSSFIDASDDFSKAFNSSMAPITEGESGFTGSVGGGFGGGGGGGW